jgi:glucan 1,3-beta-glucosidase
LSLSVEARNGKRAVTGTNLGGWMVLEPWITPSMFYQFLGKPHNETNENIGRDHYSFC